MASCPAVARLKRDVEHPADLATAHGQSNQLEGRTGTRLHLKVPFARTPSLEAWEQDALDRRARGGSGRYHLEQARRRVDVVTSVGSGVEDYHIGGPEPEGVWMGTGSGQLVLSGAVGEMQLRRVLSGLSPVGDRTLLEATSAVRFRDSTSRSPRLRA
jgi:hypothetical protein